MAQPKPLFRLTGDRLLGRNLLVAGSTLLAGALGLAFQIVVSHSLRPSDYAAVFAAMTLLTLIALQASAVSHLMARETSRDRAAGQAASSAALLRSGNRALVAGGGAFGMVLVILSPWIASVLGIAAVFVVAIAVCI